MNLNLSVNFSSVLDLLNVNSAVASSMKRLSVRQDSVGSNHSDNSSQQQQQQQRHNRDDVNSSCNNMLVAAADMQRNRWHSMTSQTTHDPERTLLVGNRSRDDMYKSNVGGPNQLHSSSLYHSHQSKDDGFGNGSTNYGLFVPFKDIYQSSGGGNNNNNNSSSSTRDQVAAVAASRASGTETIPHHHSGSCQQIDTSPNYNARRSPLALDPVDCGWPPTFGYDGAASSSEQQQHRQQHQPQSSHCDYRATQHHVESGSVGMTTRYVDASTAGTSTCVAAAADRFLQYSTHAAAVAAAAAAASTIGPPSTDALVTCQPSGPQALAHHGFVTPPPFYGEPGVTGSGFDVGGHHGSLVAITPVSSVTSSPSSDTQYGTQGCNGGASIVNDCTSSGFDVGGLTDVGNRGGFPSMTVNLSMSMNVGLHGGTAGETARRLFQQHHNQNQYISSTSYHHHQQHQPQQQHQFWNFVGGLNIDEDDDELEDSSPSPSLMHTTPATEYRLNGPPPHMMTSSSRSGLWRIPAATTSTINYFGGSSLSPASLKRAPVLSDGAESDAEKELDASEELHMYMSQRNDQIKQQQQQQQSDRSGITGANQHQQMRYGDLRHQQQLQQEAAHQPSVPDQFSTVGSRRPQQRTPTGSSSRFGTFAPVSASRCHHKLFPSGTSASGPLHPHFVHQPQQQQQRTAAGGHRGASHLMASQQGGELPSFIAGSGPRSQAACSGGGHQHHHHHHHQHHHSSRHQSPASVTAAAAAAGRPNVCRICAKTYARPSTLKTHLRTHSGEKPYTCSTCRKAFSQAANLTAHLRTHTGERPFSCPVCSRRFSQSSSVATHLRTHSGERPYRCRMCSKTFSDSSTLTKHLRIHSGEKPYQCSICLLRFSQSGNLNRHKRVHAPMSK